MEMELSYATIIVHSCPRNEKFIIVYYYRLSKRKRNKWRINLGKWSRFAPEERISDPTKDTRSQSWRDEDVNVKADRAIVNAILDFPPFFGGCWRVKLEPL